MTHPIRTVLTAVVALALGATVATQSTNQDEVLLRRAVTYEVVDGNSTGAMAIYRQLVSSSNRTVAAEATSRLEALELAEQAGQVQVRQLFEGAAYQPSRDGLLIPRPGPGGRLELFDVSTGTATVLVTSPVAGLDGAFVSPDRQQVVYRSWACCTGPGFLRVVSADGTGDRALFDTKGRVFEGEWSPDGRQFAFRHGRGPDRPGIEYVFLDVATGAQRSIEANTPAATLRFTPDGRHVVVQEGNDIFSLPVNGGSRVALVENPAIDRLVGWAPDGRLVFVSDRSGRRALWAVPVRDGRSAGEPEIVIADLGAGGEKQVIGMSPDSGSLFYEEVLVSTEINLVEINSTGTLQSDPTKLVSRFTGANSLPAYSPDGRYLAYLTGIDSSGTAEIRIRTLATGEERRLPKPTNRVRNLIWYPDSRALLVHGGSGNQQLDLNRLDVETGALTTVVERVAGGWAANPTFSPDGRYLYFREPPRPGEPANVMVRLELATGVKQEVLKISGAYLRIHALSPDGTRLAFGSRRDDGPVEPPLDVLEVVSLTGGEPTLIYQGGTRAFRGLAWTADGRSVLFHRSEGYRDELIRIPAAGGPPVPLFQTGIIHDIAVHPDGRHLAVATWRESRATYVMENLFPPAAR